MRSKATLLALTLLPASILTVAAGDADCTAIAPDTTGCETTLYLTGCDATETGKVYHQVLHGSVPLTETAPDTSFTAAGGCGTYEEPLFAGGDMGNPFYDLTIEGYGEFDNPGTVTVELHEIYASQGRATGEMELEVRLTLDGTSLFGTEQLELINGDITTTPTILTVPVTAVPSSTGLSEKLEFTIVGIYDAFPELFEVDGTGSGYTDVAVSISVTDPGAHTFVWDAVEVPANIRFNAEPAGTLVEAGSGAILGQASEG